MAHRIREWSRDRVFRAGFKPFVKFAWLVVVLGSWAATPGARAAEDPVGEERRAAREAARAAARAGDLAEAERQVRIMNALAMGGRAAKSLGAPTTVLRLRNL